MVLRSLLVCWVLALACRIFIFKEGGTLGAYVTVISFWAITFSLVILSIRELMIRKRAEPFRFALVLTMMVTFIYRAVVTEGPTAAVASMLFYGCILALLFVYARSAWKKGRNTQRPVSADS
jgi:hypothetical protein